MCELLTEDRSPLWIDLDLCDLKFNRDHLLFRGNPYTKFGIDQMKGSKDIDRTTLGRQCLKGKKEVVGASISEE